MHDARHLNIFFDALAFYLSSKHSLWNERHYAEIEAWGADRVKPSTSKEGRRTSSGKATSEPETEESSSDFSAVRGEPDRPAEPRPGRTGPGEEDPDRELRRVVAGRSRLAPKPVPPQCR